MPADVSQVKTLARDMVREGGRVGAGVAAEVRSSGGMVRDAASRNAPRRSGALAGSVTLEISGDGRSTGIAASITAGEVYGRFQEYGTSRMAAQPFMGPALDEVEPGFVARLVALSGEVLK